MINIIIYLLNFLVNFNWNNLCEIYIYNAR